MTQYVTEASLQLVQEKEEKILEQNKIIKKLKNLVKQLYNDNIKKDAAIIEKDKKIIKLETILKKLQINGENADNDTNMICGFLCTLLPNLKYMF